MGEWRTRDGDVRRDGERERERGGKRGMEERDGAGSLIPPVVRCAALLMC